MKLWSCSVVLLATSMCWGCATVEAEVHEPARDNALIEWREYFVDDDLRSLIESALDSNFDLRIAAQRIQAARARVEAAGGRLLPIVDAVAGAGGTHPSELVDYDYVLGFQASWELDLWGRLRHMRDAAMHRLLASLEGRHLVQTAIVGDVCAAYYELLALDANLVIIEDSIRLEERALGAVRVQRTVGAANELAVRQFEAQLENLMTLKLEMKTRIVENESLINGLIGREPQPIERGRVSLAEARLPALALEVPAAYLTHRPDVRQAELELRAARADVESARAAFLPTAAITGFLSLQSFRSRRLFDSESVAYSVVGSALAPILNRSAIQAEYDGADAMQREALYTYEQTLTNATLEVHSQLATISLLEEAGARKTREVGLLEASVRTAEELFRMGDAGYLEVLNVQQNGLRARLELVDLKKRQLQSSVALYRALGGGVEEVKPPPGEAGQREAP
jgi:NodT family efflux transporter outer membrane factor (OMF) lipoprotein